MSKIELRKITKRFSGVAALESVDLCIQTGEVLALVGENGAGKSTLMKILSGVYPANSFEGQIEIDGKAKKFYSPLDAESAGIAIIHQELSPFRHLSVAENLFVGHWPKKMGVVDWDEVRVQAKTWLDRVGVRVDLDRPVGELSVGVQQMIEIAKALSRDSRFIVLDEPTSALTPKEVDRLFELIRKLKKDGRGLVYISHKMEEIYAIADRAAILRDGRSVHAAPLKDLTQARLIEHIVGRSLDRLFPTPPQRQVGEVLLEVKELEGTTLAGTKQFGPVSFTLRRGEILGFAGLLGSGRTELLKAIFGEPSIQVRGQIQLKGKRYIPRRPIDGLRSGLSFVSEDRKGESIFLGRSLDENCGMSRLAAEGLTRMIRPDEESRRTIESLKRLRTKCRDGEQEIQTLSGGNQQKVVIARALQTSPDILILDEPTRGVDVGAKYEIYEILFELASQGKGLLVISSELPELMALSDRILVLNQGKDEGSLARDQFSQVAIMEMAIGARHQQQEVQDVQSFN